MVENLRWRPIETAPKHSRVQILLLVDGRTRVGYWQGGPDPADLGPDDEPWTAEELAGGWHVQEPHDLEGTSAEPTDWMPLPEPPLERRKR